MQAQAEVVEAHALGGQQLEHPRVNRMQLGRATTVPLAAAGWLETPTSTPAGVGQPAQAAAAPGSSATSSTRSGDSGRPADGIGRPVR